MNIDKVFHKKLFKNLFSDPCKIRFWDGEVENYGEGEIKFEIIFNEPISKADIINDPSLAFGEGYMTKKVEIVGNIEDVVASIYNNKESFLSNSSKYAHIIKKISNNLKKSKENIEHHYDIGNDFYKLWLDDSMTYSCAYFRNPDDSLYQAQENKINHILKKLALKEGQTLLDIGCGWGELIINAAKKYKVKAMGVTLSSEQFDRVVSVGMIEHVGKDHLNEYFAKVNELLTKGGLSLLHCITGQEDNIEGGTNSWINKYIFPGGYIPSVKELVSYMVSEKLCFIDMENLRRHYCGNIYVHQFLFTKGVNNDLPWSRG